MSLDAIEIHFNEKRGYLELACERDAFAAYRDVAREHLKDFPEIPIDEVIEMNIVDVAAFVARRDAPKPRFLTVLFGIVVAIVLILALVGACVLVKRIVG